MTNKAKTLRQSLERGALFVRPLELIMQTGDLKEQELVLLERSLTSLHAQSQTIEQTLQELVQTYRQQESSAKQQIWERKLLDLSLRNNLLNMRPGRNAFALDSGNISSLEDELSGGEELLLQGKTLTQIYRTARNNIEETGANTLFLALGTLLWKEKQSGKEHKAPILLMPVEIVKVKGKDSYAVRWRDEETVLNVTLTEMLRVEFDIVVPGVNPLPADEHGVDVSLVLHRFAEAVSEQPEWMVCEEAVLGNFSFTKYVMWNDIHRNSTVMEANPIVRSLIEGRLVMEMSEQAVDMRQEDAMMSPSSHLIPLDADSSQIEALIEAEMGRSFILNGPPGTGKSQSITNMIANALYHGQRVLFVAQKKAALDVVKSRLDKIGLSAFCLEIHSNKVDKKNFLMQMQRSIEFTLDEPKTEYQKLADELLFERQKLNSHIEALHRKRATGLSLYGHIEKTLSISVEPIQMPENFIKEADPGLPGTVKEKILALASGSLTLGGAPGEHPLRGLWPKRQDTSMSLSCSYGKRESLEDVLKVLPDLLIPLKQQIERNRKLAFFTKTTRQYIEGEYKLKKFFQLASIEENLLEDIDAFIESAVRWKDNVDKLAKWTVYADLAYVLKDMGLEEINVRYQAGESVEDLCEAFEAGYHKSMAHNIISTDASLSEYTGIQLDGIIQKYTQLQKEFQQVSRQELICRLAGKAVTKSLDPAISAELTLLRKRIGNKGRGTTVRAMIDQMPKLLRSLCPVMLMSPLSVAQYINADSEKFDLVIFDEASQMPTCDAVGSIARSKAAVIVGDTRQMPPTDFFNINVTDDDEADIDDLESILDDCIALSLPSHTLNWHYRSNHEGLISFSNHHYYDGSLITFPSVDDCCSKVTLEYVDGFYDMGKTRTNKAEAQAVVKEILMRLKTQPQQSIGVVAFSLQQSDLIEDLLSDAFAAEPELERINMESEEPLFVKNLENVQGDERDVILFSIGYGPDKEGKVSMNFGPLNKMGGERRLNVAITRARCEMKVFSTLRPEQIDERRTQAEGVLGLKAFLRFAEGRDMPVVSREDSQTTTDVVPVQVAEWLKTQGYETRVNVGSSSSKIDVAVLNPVNKSEYVLGILCDGNNYYRLRTMRDREIVRPAVYGRLGWKLFRLSTLDWFRHRDMVKKQILGALK